MTMLARNALVALTLVCFTGCSTLRPIEDFSPSRIVAEVKPGDRVHIVALTGVIYDLDVLKVEDDSLTGKAKSGKQYKIIYEAIQSIEVEKPDLVKSVGGTLGTVVVLAGIALVYATIVFFRALDD